MRLISMAVTDQLALMGLPVAVTLPYCVAVSDASEARARHSMGAWALALDSNLRRFTGIDVLMATKESHWRASVYAADDVTWSKWAGREALELWQLVACTATSIRTVSGLVREALATRWQTSHFDNLPVRQSTEIDHDDPMRRLLKNLERASQSFGVDGLRGMSIAMSRMTRRRATHQIAGRSLASPLPSQR
jgi:hypothetical protein